MDKPTLTQEDRELFHYNPNTDDIIERVKAYGDAMAAWGAAQALEVETDSRRMFVARLENLQENGDCWLSVASVLALLNDCDMLAQQHTKEIDHDHT